MTNREEENPEEGLLIRRAQDGDPSAYDALILRYQETILTQMRRFSRDRRIMEELAQNVFVNAYFSLRNYRPEAPFLNWLRTIASRTGYAFWREEYKRARHVPIEDWDGADKDEKQDDRAARQLDWLLNQLKPAERQVISLLYLDNLSIAETSQRTGWTEGMVKMRAHRARKKMQRIVAERGEGGIGHG